MYEQPSTPFWRSAFTVLCLTLLIWGISRIRAPSYFQKKAIQVLCYHDITPNPVNRFGRTPTQLAKDFEMLTNNGVQVVPLESVVQYLQSSKKLPKNWLVITFDDASKGQFDFARPLLKRYAFPATFFVPTKSVEDKTPVSSDYSGVMSWQELLTLKEEGFSLESHGHTHHSFARLTTPQLENDISTSLDILRDKLEITSQNLGLPFGEYLPRNELSFLRMAIQSISLTTTDHGPGQKSLIKIHRFEINSDTSQDEILATIRPL